MNRRLANEAARDECWARLEEHLDYFQAMVDALPDVEQMESFPAVLQKIALEAVVSEIEYRQDSRNTLGLGEISSRDGFEPRPPRALPWTRWVCHVVGHPRRLVDHATEALVRDCPRCGRPYP